MNNTIALEQQYCANEYAPLPVVLVKGQGVYLWDDAGKQYLDMMSAYSAVSHGHCHPRLAKTICTQAQTLTLTSRAFFSAPLGPFLKDLCELVDQDQALPMNSGAEGVETAIKAARKWAYTVKKVPENQAEIIVCRGNFHGRTTTIVSFSSEPQYRFGFGPLTPGFKQIDYGDLHGLKKAITPNTAAFLLEPMQGEGGIIVPPPGFLSDAQTICQDRNVLLICDEIQTGLGRTGKLLACQHEDVKPDGLILGKALGGGMMPVSAFLSRDEVMNVFTPGDHGSTFGGNALAASVAHEAIKILQDEQLIENSAKMGVYFMKKLAAIDSPLIKSIRGKGLFIGVEVDTEKIRARDICLKLMKKGVLSKETHKTVIRFTPPLIINQAQIDQAVDIIHDVFTAYE